jgi:hypothetical protein
MSTEPPERDDVSSFAGYGYLEGYLPESVEKELRDLQTRV